MWKFNRWYDRLDDPGRLLLLMVFIVVCVSAVNAEAFVADPVAILIASVAGWGAMLAVILMRVHHLYFRKRERPGPARLRVIEGGKSGK